MAWQTCFEILHIFTYQKHLWNFIKFYVIFIFIVLCYSLWVMLIPNLHFQLSLEFFKFLPKSWSGLLMELQNYATQHTYIMQESFIVLTLIGYYSFYFYLRILICQNIPATLRTSWLNLNLPWGIFDLSTCSRYSSECFLL